MAATFVADYKADSGSVSVNTLSVSLSGTTEGNLLVAVLFVRYAWGIPPADGWTPVLNVGRTASHHGVHVWYKYATGSDTYEPSWGGAAAKVVAIIRELSDVPASAPVCGWSTNSAKVFEDGTNSVTTTSFSPPVASGAILSVLCVQDWQDWTGGTTGADITAPGSNTEYSYSTTAANLPLVGISQSSFSAALGITSTWSTSDVDAGGDGRQGCIDIYLSDEPYTDIPVPIERWSSYDTGTSNTSGSLTVSGATAGNMLVAICCKADHAGTTTTATGYTSRGWWNAATETWSGRWFTRTATGDSNDDFNPSWTGGASYDLLVVEVANVGSIVPEDTGENTAEIDDTAASTITTGSVTPTSESSIAIAVFACESRQDWSNLTFGRSLGGEAGWMWFANGTQGAGDAYSKIGIKVLHDTSSEAMTITSTGFDGVAYADAGIFPTAVQPNAEFTINSIETWTDTIHGDGVTVQANLSNATASGKRVYIKQGGTTVEQTVISESTSQITFTADYGALLRGDATLQVVGD